MKFVLQFILSVSLVILSACNITPSSDSEADSKGDLDYIKSKLEQKDESSEIESSFKEKSRSLFSVRIDNQSGFINEKGDMIIQPQFDMVDDFSEGLAKVIIGEKVGYINMEGKYLINPQFNSGDSFSEGLASIFLDDEYGYINKKGDVVIKPQFDHAMPFSNDLAGVCLTTSLDGIWEQKKCGYINQEGNIHINYQFGSVHPFREGVAMVASVDDDGLEGTGKWGIINTEGKYIVNPTFDLAGDFSEGLAPVSVDGKWGYVDKKGDYVIPLQYDHAFSFSDGLGAVCNYINSEEVYDVYSCGFLNRNGEEAIKLQYDLEIGTARGGNPWDSINLAFSEGLAVIQADGDYGYINKKGEFKINPQYEYASPFKDRLASVILYDGKQAVINKVGKVIWSE